MCDTYQGLAIRRNDQSEDAEGLLQSRFPRLRDVQVETRPFVCRNCAVFQKRSLLHF
jgi:hypothetical protein